MMYILLGFVIVLFSFSLLAAVASLLCRRLVCGNGKLVYDKNASSQTRLVFHPKNNDSISVIYSGQDEIVVRYNSKEFNLLSFSSLRKELSYAIKEFKKQL